VAKSDDCKLLASLSEKRSALCDASSKDSSEIEGEIDEIVARLWGISTQELATIQKALSEYAAIPSTEEHEASEDIEQ